MYTVRRDCSTQPVRLSPPSHYNNVTIYHIIIPEAVSIIVLYNIIMKISCDIKKRHAMNRTVLNNCQYYKLTAESSLYCGTSSRCCAAAHHDVCVRETHLIFLLTDTKGLIITVGQKVKHHHRGRRR